ncbi:MAG: lysophospholipid acyltransferase family protein, partial [Spongiibacteraceae bacterium]
ERYGFVKLAAKHGYTIIPTAVVGPEDFYNHLMEGEDIPNSLAGKLLKRVGLLTDNTRTDIMGPVPLGLFGTILPRPQRCYVKFGDPLDLSEYKGKVPSKKNQDSIRTEVATSINHMIAELFLLRAQKRSSDSLLRRFFTI